MDYGIPKPSDFYFDKTSSVNITSDVYELYLKNIYDSLVLELPDDATKNVIIGSKYRQFVDETINCPDLLNANRLTISSEALIGVSFGDYQNYGGVQKFSNKASANWNAMSLGVEPDLFFILRTQQAYTNAYMDNAFYSYSNDRIIVLAKYRYTGGGYQHQFMLDFKKSDNAFGMSIDLYYVCGNYASIPYSWLKLPYLSNGMVDFYADSNYRNNFVVDINTTFQFKKFNIGYIPEIRYNNIRFDLLKNDLNYNLIESFNFGEINKTEYYESYRNVNFYDNHNYFDNQPNISFGKVDNIDKSDWKIYNENWIADLNKDSILKPYVNIKGFIEGKQSDYVNETKFVYNSFNSIFKTIKSFNYDFDEYVDSRDISIIVDGRRRYIDINKPMIKGYISGKINTSGCSGQLFKIRCYRHSNIDFIGEYDVDVSGNYFIPNLNYLDEYDIMLVDSNSVIETKVSSKRKPILNDEINELKLGVHTSTLNTDLLILFEFSLLKFSYNKTASPWVQDDAKLIPKPYEMYYNITTSYSGYINWWEYGKKYYMNSNAHITDVRYIDNNNVINNIIKNAEFEITVTFNHFGHSYSQWNSLFACSDTSNQGNVLVIYNDSLSFGMYDKVKNITYTTTGMSVSRNKVYTASIKRKGNLVTLTVADAITLDNKFSTNLELPSDFTWDFSKIKLGCAWGGSQFWGDFVDFEFRVL